MFAVSGNTQSVSTKFFVIELVERCTVLQPIRFTSCGSYYSLFIHRQHRPNVSQKLYKFLIVAVEL
jgi:hypothetical protein